MKSAVLLPRSRTAFTLMELLVVLAIIAVLAAIIIATVPLVMDQAKALTTQQRLQQVKTQLGLRGQEMGSICYYLQNGIAAFGGTLEFERTSGDDYMVPKDGAAWHRTYPQAQGLAPLVLAYPWGQGRTYYIREDWYANAFSPNLAVTDPNTWSVDEREAWATAEEHDLSELYPRRSGEILVLLGLADSLADYRNDRGPQRPFNDAWGNPLVVAYAIYQPPRYAPPSIPAWSTGHFYAAGEWVEDGGQRYLCILTHDNPSDPSDSGNRPGTSDGAAYWVEALHDDDHYLQQAYQDYGYNRAVYLAIGASGPSLSPNVFPTGSVPTGGDDMAWDGYLDALWAQVCTVCMPDATATWDESSFDDPPWKGTRQAEGGYQGVACECFLSTPAAYE